MIMTNFFTAANKRYELFVPIYAASVLSSNSDATVEVVLEDKDAVARHDAIVSVINEVYSDRFHVRQGDFSHKTPNIVRFIEQPERISRYTYIGDIDIVVVENVTAFHERKLDELGLPHTNVIRKDQERLTGLHFCISSEHYPITTRGFDILSSEPSTDEEFLYWLYEQRGQLPPESHKSRPEHGIHISLNRRPYGKMSWGMNPVFFDRTEALFSSPEWKEISGCVSGKTSWMVNLLLLAIQAHSLFSSEDLGTIRTMFRHK